MRMEPLTRKGPGGGDAGLEVGGVMCSIGDVCGFRHWGASGQRFTEDLSWPLVQAAITKDYRLDGL